MPRLDTLFGYNALNAKLEIESVADKTVTATAALPEYSDSRRAWVIPVVRERNELGGLKVAAEWIPTDDWNTVKKPFLAVRGPLGTGSEAKVEFDFNSAPKAEGAAVLFIVHSPKQTFERYVDVLSLAVTTLHLAGEPGTARAVASITDSITRNRSLVPSAKNTATFVAITAATDSNKGTESTASLTEDEALERALQFSLIGSVIEKP